MVDEFGKLNNIRVRVDDQSSHTWYVRVIQCLLYERSTSIVITVVSFIIQYIRDSRL